MKNIAANESLLEELKDIREKNDLTCWSKKEDKHWVWHKKFIMELEKLKEEKYAEDAQISKGLQATIDIYSCRDALVTVRARLSRGSMTEVILKELGYSYLERDRMEQQLFEEDKFYAEQILKIHNQYKSLDHKKAKETKTKKDVQKKKKKKRK